jgi:predicted enzyme related to lactoylglutathione lyase
MTHSSRRRYKSILVTVTIMFLGVTACTTVSTSDLTGMSFSTEPLQGKVIWHDLITEDLEGARRFYGELFGWTFENSSGARGENYMLARNNNVYVAGMVEIDAANDGNKYSRWLPYISVADVDDAVTASVAAGGSVAGEARNVNVGRVAAIVDPQGAVIGLAKSNIGDPDDTTTAAEPGRPVWTELLANDPQAAATFYSGLANYETHTIPRRGGEYTILANGGIHRAGIFKNPAEEKYTPVWITAFGVNDPATAAAKVASLGGTIILPVSPQLRDGTTAVVTDPSGAILVLQKWSWKGE